jgi:hypothetical protein
MSLSQLLEKLGLKYEDLTEEEKKTYTQWHEVLSQSEVTIDDLKKFIPAQIEQLEDQQNDYKNSKEKDLFLKAQIRNLKMIHAFILGPEQRRKWLEDHINKQLINK